MIVIYELGRLGNRMIKECILAVLSMIFSVSMVSSFFTSKVKLQENLAILVDDKYKMLLALVICLIIWLMRVITKSKTLFFKKYFTFMSIVDFLLGTFIWGQMLAQIEMFYKFDTNQSNTIILLMLIMFFVYFYLEHLVFIKIVKQPIEWKNSERYIRIEEIANVTYLNVKHALLIGTDISKLPDDYFRKYTIKTTYRTKWLGIFMSDYAYEKVDTFDLAEQIIE